MRPRSLGVDAGVSGPVLSGVDVGVSQCRLLKSPSFFVDWIRPLDKNRLATDEDLFLGSRSEPSPPGLSFRPDHAAPCLRSQSPRHGSSLSGLFWLFRVPRNPLLSLGLIRSGQF